MAVDADAVSDRSRGEREGIPVPSEEWACPGCGAGLTPRDPTHFVCASPACGREYPVIRGVPVLINDVRSVFRIADFVEDIPTTLDWGRQARRQAARGPFRAALRFIADRSPSLSLRIGKFNADDAVRTVLTERPEARVLVIGCGDHRFAAPASAKIVYTDVALGPLTAMVCDATDIPFKTATFDTVIADAVIAYVADPDRCVAEIARVLRPDGRVYATAAFMQQVHMGKYDFTRFTYLGHRRLFRRFDAIERGIASGPAMALAWSIQFFLESFFENVKARQVVRLGTRYGLFWLKYLDRALAGRRGAFDAASGFYFYGRKREFELSDREILESHVGLRPK